MLECNCRANRMLPPHTACINMLTINRDSETHWSQNRLHSAGAGVGYSLWSLTLLKRYMAHPKGWFLAEYSLFARSLYPRLSISASDILNRMEDFPIGSSDRLWARYRHVQGRHLINQMYEFCLRGAALSTYMMQKNNDLLIMVRFTYYFPSRFLFQCAYSLAI